MTHPNDATTPALLAGRYRLGRHLGSGGMADVYRATDERLHRPVAVKVLRAGTASDTEGGAVTRARFAAEGRMAAKLNHPAIVALYDAGEDHDQAFLVMECMPGPTLSDRLRSDPPTVAEIHDLLADVLGVLDAAHRAGFVHRDVKPANILATEDGRWKVADFGIAQAEEAVPGTEDLTSTGLLVGTPRYVAPERFAGQRATAASDLYSVGVLLEELLARAPQPSTTLAAVAARARALDPAQRFSSAASMAAAVGDAPTFAAPTPTSPSSTPGLLSADAETAIAAPGPTAVLSDARRRPRRSRRWGVAAAVAIVALSALAVGALRGSDASAPAGGPTTSTTSPQVTAAPSTGLPPATAAPTPPPVPVTAAPTTRPAPGGPGKGKDGTKPKGQGKGKAKG